MKLCSKIRESLRKAQEKEAQLIQKSLRDDSERVLDGIAPARVEAEVASKRITVGEQSLAAEGVEAIAKLVRELQGLLIQELADLKAERTKAHYAVISKELDSDAIDRFSIRVGLGRGPDLLWRLAALAPNVLELEAFFPHLSWIHPGLVELNLKRVEEDAERLFGFIKAFEDHVGAVPKLIES